MLRIIHHLAGKSGETRGRGFRVEHHLCRHQLSAQAGVHHLLPQQQGQPPALSQSSCQKIDMVNIQESREN